MIYVYEGGAYLKVEGSERELAALGGKLAYKNPAAWFSPSYQLYIKTRNTRTPRGWDGYMRPLHRIPGKGDRRRASILRGWRETLLEAADELDIQVDREFLLKSPFKELQIEDIPDDIVKSKFALDDDQKTCVVEWLRNLIGIHHMSVSAGKTVTFCAAIAMIKRTHPKARAIYFTPTERLLKQVVKEARAFLPGMEIGQFGGGKREFKAKDVVVATTASLGKHFKKLKEMEWFNSFQIMCADECQSMASPTLAKVGLEIPAMYRLGASDTQKADDIMAHNQIMGLVGHRLHSVVAAPLIEKGRIAVPHIYLIDVPEWENKFEDLENTAPVPSPAWVLQDNQWNKAEYLGPVMEQPEDDRLPATIKTGVHLLRQDDHEFEAEARWCLLKRTYDQAIIRFAARNRMIAAWAKHFTAEYGQTLIICTRTTHVYILEAVLQETMPPENIGILFSQHTSRQRDQMFDWFKTNPKAVLITPLVKVGVSINEIRAGIIADRVADWEYFNQLVGRMIRKKVGRNEAHIATFVDRQHPKYRASCGKIFDRLQKIKGYNFYHPVQLPDTVANAKFYRSSLV